MVEQGDIVEITTKKNSVVEGILVDVKDDIYTLKQDSGYNLSYFKINVKKIKKKGSKTFTKKSVFEEQVFDSKKKTISILHTGGTIASKVDYETGAVGSTFKPEELLTLFPEIAQFANIKSRLVKNMWSQDMRFSHYNIIAKEIKKEIDSGVDGIIVSQGTDTLHYTASALSFCLEDLNVPVVVVGAQRSSDRPSTDARDNLVNAVYFLTKSNFCDVGICMHSSSSDLGCNILPGTKTRKSHTSRRDAFKAINSSAYAHVDYRKDKIKIIDDSYNVSSEREFKLKLFNENVKVGLLKQHTNMFAEQFLFFRRYDGLIIESTGLGCLPISEKDKETKESGRIFNAIKSLVKKGVVVAEAAQTTNGRIVLNVYEDQRNAQNIGVIGSYSDMTSETSFIKMAWLLSNYDKKDVKKLFLTNLRGELTKSTKYYDI